MSLKLFRSTGYSSLLTAGETRASMHPGWVIVACSTWAGFVCNVALWRELGGGAFESASLVQALAQGLFVTAVCGIALSLLAWRRTLKTASTFVLVASALTACAIWVQSIPIDVTLKDRPLASLVLPPWASLLRWQVAALLVVLAAVPVVWVWNTHVRRLPGPRQLTANLRAAAIGAIVLGASALLLHGF